MLVKKIIALVYCCTLMHATFGGSGWSQSQKTTNFVEMPTAQELETAINQEKTINWINKERFIHNVAAQKVDPTTLVTLIEQEFDQVWKERIEKNLGFYTLIAQSQFQESKETGKPLLLGILLKNHPEMVTKLLEKK